jgi:hypothetical protein
MTRRTLFKSAAATVALALLPKLPAVPVAKPQLPRLKAWRGPRWEYVTDPQTGITFATADGCHARWMQVMVCDTGKPMEAWFLVLDSHEETRAYSEDCLLKCATA